MFFLACINCLSVFNFEDELISLDWFCMNFPPLWLHADVKDGINLTEYNKGIRIIT